MSFIFQVLQKKFSEELEIESKALQTDEERYSILQEKEQSLLRSLSLKRKEVLESKDSLKHLNDLVVQKEAELLSIESNQSVDLESKKAYNQSSKNKSQFEINELEKQRKESENKKEAVQCSYEKSIKSLVNQHDNEINEVNARIKAVLDRSDATTMKLEVDLENIKTEAVKKKLEVDEIRRKAILQQ